MFSMGYHFKNVSAYDDVVRSFKEQDVFLLVFRYKIEFHTIYIINHVLTTFNHFISIYSYSDTFESSKISARNSATVLRSCGDSYKDCRNTHFFLSMWTRR